MKAGPVTPSNVKVMVCSSSPPISMLGNVTSEMKPVPVRIPPVPVDDTAGSVIVIVSSSPLGSEADPSTGNTEVTWTLPASQRSAAIFFIKPSSLRHEASMDSIDHVGRVTERTQAVDPPPVIETVVPCPVVPMIGIVVFLS